MTRLFDANAHPALSGTALDKPASFELLTSRLTASDFAGACAVGLPGCGQYNHAAFLSECRQHGLEPIAAWGDVPLAQLEQEARAIKNLGYSGIKVHPRLSGMSVREPRFARLLQVAASENLVVFHCTYQFGADVSLHPVDPLPFLMEAVSAVPNLRMVLLHGGTIEVLRYAEAIRSNPNLLLDLSFTLNRYRGSSVDLDIGYLFKSFDQRICVGTDFPEYDPSDVRERFEAFASGLQEEKRDNIGWKNITTLMKSRCALDR